MKKGRNYEDYAMKFLRGANLVADYEECFDIETKNMLVEVKGAQAFVLAKQNKSQLRKYPGSKKEFSRIGRYIVRLDNHAMLYLRSWKELKEPVYLFMLSVGGRMLFKYVSWHHVEKLLNDGLSDKENKNERKISVSDIW